MRREGITIVVTGLASVLACALPTGQTEGPRVAANGDNVDHYGRPTDAAARACFDKCMRQVDTLDVLAGGSETYKTDERQKQACWDECAPRVKEKTCDAGESKPCTCPNPDDFGAPPLQGARVCDDGFGFSSCDCTPQPEPAPAPVVTTPAEIRTSPTPTTSDPFAAEKGCKDAIKTQCVAVCNPKNPEARGPCEVECLRRPMSDFDGTLKECTPDIGGYQPPDDKATVTPR